MNNRELLVQLRQAHFSAKSALADNHAQLAEPQHDPLRQFLLFAGDAPRDLAQAEFWFGCYLSDLACVRAGSETAFKGRNLREELKASRVLPFAKALSVDPRDLWEVSSLFRVLTDTLDLWALAPNMQILQRTCLRKKRGGIWNVTWPWWGSERILSLTADGMGYLMAEVIEQDANGPTLLRLMSHNDPVKWSVVDEACEERRQMAARWVRDDAYVYERDVHIIKALPSLTLNLEEFCCLIDQLWSSTVRDTD